MDVDGYWFPEWLSTVCCLKNFGVWPLEGWVCTVNPAPILSGEATPGPNLLPQSPPQFHAMGCARKQRWNRDPSIPSRPLQLDAFLHNLHFYSNNGVAVHVSTDQIIWDISSTLWIPLVINPGIWKSSNLSGIARNPSRCRLCIWGPWLGSGPYPGGMVIWR